MKELLGEIDDLLARMSFNTELATKDDVANVLRLLALIVEKLVSVDSVDNQNP